MNLNIEYKYCYDYIDFVKIKSYWITYIDVDDEDVGSKIYFLDDVPVAFANKKYDESDDIYWFSKDYAIKVRDYIIDLIPPHTHLDNIETCDINEDIGDTWNGIKFDLRKVQIYEIFN